MPSKEWLSQHSKVAAYLKPELYELLQDWKNERNIKQDSQALIAILEHYLNEEPPPEISNQFLEERVEQLEKEVAEMKQLLFNVGAKILAPKVETAKGDFYPPTELIEIEYTESEIEKGLTKGQLCKKIGLTVSQADKASKEQDLSIEDYIFKITGWKAGEGNKPRYFLFDEADEAKLNKTVETEASETPTTEEIETKASETNEIESDDLDD